MPSAASERPVGVISDAHANLPATSAAVDELRRRGCEIIVHVGDAVGIGPHPAEVVTLLAERDVWCIMGNHDQWCAFGLPEPLPPTFTSGRVAHQRWVSQQLSQAQRGWLRRWRYDLRLSIGGDEVAFCHAPRRPDGEFVDVATRSPSELDAAFIAVTADVIVFGHTHEPCDVRTAGRRYLNPGSLGCHDRAEARSLILTIGADGHVAPSPLVVGYADGQLFADLDQRAVPERDFIRRVYITRE